MSRSFLTGLNLNKNELLNARIQNLSTAPSSPVAGQIYYDTDTNQITVWNGTSWQSLAAGGDTATMITTAIDALTTDVIEEGTTNLYFTNERAQDAIGTAIAAGTQTRITVTYSDASNKIDFVADDQWAGKTTSDLAEGTNLYFTDERAQDAVGNAVGTGLSYNDTSGAISVDTNTIASKTYVDGLVQGLSVKDSVRAATAVSGTLATSFANGSTVGGVTLATNDRILIKNQATATENGIYTVNASGAPTRATDADPVASELDKGTYVLVTDGTYAATGWVVTDYSSGATTWTQFSAANEYSAGNGIAIASNVISADLDTLSGLALGAGGLSVNLGASSGLSKDALTGAININRGTGLTVNGSNELTFASGYGVQKYAASNVLIEPTSNVATWVVTHSLGSRDVEVQVYELSGYAQVEVDVVRTNTAAVTLSWSATANVSADTYRVVVIG
jgi:hypothetical protein